MKKLILSVLVALLATDIALGQCPLAFSGADNALIGIYIAPISGGEPLVDYNSERMFTPASVMKSITTAAALTQRGGNYRWETTVAAVGEITDSTLNGNIIITGSGDPTLASSQFRNDCPDFLQTVKQAVDAAGIQTIEGTICEGGKPWPDQGAIPSWEIEDVSSIDGAGFYSLNYRDNVFRLLYPSLRSVPHIPGLEVVKVGGNSGLKAERLPGSWQVRIYGQAMNNQRTSFSCTMPDPPAVLFHELDSIFSPLKRDISPQPDTLRLTTYRSPELRKVTRSLMVRSDNQMAEGVLRLLAPGQSRKQALATERTILTKLGVDLQNSRIVDGSGLSRHNSVSPRLLATVLTAMATNSDYVASFARVGTDGTVKSFMKGVKGRENFVLKSGSMTGVICYVGYRLDAQTGKPTHVIAMMVNNVYDSQAARTAMSRLLASLF